MQYIHVGNFLFIQFLIQLFVFKKEKEKKSDLSPIYIRGLKTRVTRTATGE